MFTSEQKVSITIALYGGLSVKQSAELFGAFINYDKLWMEFSKNESLIKSIIGEKKFTLLADNMNDSIFEMNMERLNRDGINVVTQFDDDYPEIFTALPDAPLVLFYKGDLDIIDSNTIAVAGTRRYSSYGKRVTENFVTALTQANLTIVTGLSQGIETIAFDTAIKCQGKTISVLSSGFYECYPPSAKASIEKAVNHGGLVISEYAPNTRLQNYHFLERNRLITHISQGIIIVEAGLKSGTMGIVELASEYGKSLYAVPGDIFSSVSKGTNQLIKDYACVVATDPQDIIKDFACVYKSSNEIVNDFNFSLDEIKIIKALENECLTLNEIKEQTDINIGELGELLSLLEISGIIAKDGSGYRLVINININDDVLE